MVPSKLKRHLTLKHNHLANKSRSYFEGLLSEQKQQSAMLSKKVKVADKAQEASYLVAELVVKSMKPHTIAETLILPAFNAIVKTMFESEAEKEVRKIPVSDSTIGRRIHDMSADIEETVCTSVKESEMFALQVDESTDIGGMAQLLVFVRYIHDVKILNQFFCCKELKETTTGNDIFSTLTTLMEEEQLVELRHDRDLKLLHMQLPLDEFWVHIKTKYPHVAKKALVMLIQFSTSYQCELGFSAVANIKANKRERLNTLEEEMRVKYI
ncbi:zinc finger BED domain-containing protein 5-like [Palaemon carinicauda]|uniref:zinc finger BED domain-containing protein 5-like n=1 Tax=Palaemon carinicauda TaxID=392227 RepID=UPI0035B57765